ncbi:iron-containing alcohol dehydrogenase [candidate division KSB1 bacterium]|nr:iron-containing alcohol dehydrogenase [candidate division KSB1 bacterium]RQW00117.1 MAG: iron-containing alcohol dehydrogenase [candidate division KSB1 bacterium]
MSSLSDHTNVLSSRFGRDVIQNIGRDIGRFCVTTMEIPWHLTKDKLGATPQHVFIINSMEQTSLDSLADTLPPCETIVGIGGGQAIDAAKYLSWKKGLRLVTIPTILSVDAFVTEAAGIRQNHQVTYVGKASPDPLVIDYDIIRTAPKTLNIAGIGDVLSIHTACFDWHLAEQHNRSEYPYSPQVAHDAHVILSDMTSVLGDIRDVTDTGLRAIVEAYMKMNTIALPAGHWRFEEGSEHFVFYELEQRLKRAFVHGHIVGLGIYLMSRLQDNAYDHVTHIMNDAQLAYHPKDLDISKSVLAASLKNCRFFVEQKKLWFSILNVEEITDEWLTWAFSALTCKDE